METGKVFTMKFIEKALLTDIIDYECVEWEAKIAQHAIIGNSCIVQVGGIAGGGGGSGGDGTVDRGGGGVPSIGVAHRDIKPDNVLFDEGGGLKLADFELAKCFGDGQLLRGLVGMPYYVAIKEVVGQN
ncbi:putative Calcium-dependent protein kinase 20 [Cocos nucifera]|uniref:non-specific serine/threonine protein kinase n=1 Tax=Cocos nucifera TaxID=13894 RepID=A0A8K0IHF8_COCNU|nr:putative Calcium-dependent protein kinase 20 [Cocos nucifera]